MSDFPERHYFNGEEVNINLLKEIMKDMTLLWSQFLKITNESINSSSTSLKTPNRSQIDQIDQAFDEDSVIIDKGNEISVIDNPDEFKTRTDDLLKNATESLRLEDLQLFFDAKNSNPIHSKQIIQFFSDLLTLLLSMEKNLDKFIVENKKQFDELSSKILIFNTNQIRQAFDMSTAEAIFHDNLITIVQILQLMLGDAEENKLQDLIDRLNYYNWTIASNPIQDPITKKPYSLHLTALFGKLQFSTLANMARAAKVIKSPPELKELEGKILEILKIDSGRFKHWDGCLAISTIPSTMKTVCRLLTLLFPERYQLVDNKLQII